jgi:hypothetical protein
VEEAGMIGTSELGAGMSEAIVLMTSDTGSKGAAELEATSGSGEEVG